MQKIDRKIFIIIRAVMDWNKFPVGYRVMKAAPAWISQ